MQKKPAVDRAPRLHQRNLFCWLFRVRNAGGLRIWHMRWPFALCALESSGASALHGRLHDMIDASSWFSSRVRCRAGVWPSCDIRYDCSMLLLPIMSGFGLGKVYSVLLLLFYLFFIFCSCAMFSPLVASHFICDLWAGTALPEVNADCLTPDVDSGDIFMSKKRWILYFPL